MQTRIFITGIGTDVGKTIASAVVVEAIQADYWKPIQAGDLDWSDSHKVQSLVSNKKSVFHPPQYALKTPMSPHAAAEIDGLQISLSTIQTPLTNNNLVVEGAGGLLVPINEQETILDLILPNDKIILVSRNYLGSINHTLLSIEVLLAYNFTNIGILFNGEEEPSTKKIIQHKTNLPIVGRIRNLNPVNKETIAKEATRLQENLSAFVHSA